MVNRGVTAVETAAAGTAPVSKADTIAAIAAACRRLPDLTSRIASPRPVVAGPARR